MFSLILVVQKSTQTRIKIIGRLPNSDEWVPIDEDESAQEEIPGVLVVRIRESLSFANTGQLKERLRRVSLLQRRSDPQHAYMLTIARALWRAEVTPFRCASTRVCESCDPAHGRCKLAVRHGMDEADVRWKT